VTFPTVPRETVRNPVYTSTTSEPIVMVTLYSVGESGDQSDGLGTVNVNAELEVPFDPPMEWVDELVCTYALTLCAEPSDEWTVMFTVYGVSYHSPDSLDSPARAREDSRKWSVPSWELSYAPRPSMSAEMSTAAMWLAGTGSMNTLCQIPVHGV
jgi:hypothetical protein